MSGAAIKLFFSAFLFVHIYTSLCLDLDKDMQKILSELTWSTKIKFLEFVSENKNMTDSSLLFSAGMPLALRRRVRSVESRRVSNTTTPVAGDDDLMKMKLFRLMYETVKDSDLKIKRAELVKAQYENATGFDLGYVVGDVTDKLNVMQDISNTLKRLYDVWRPVEHVNAYEQVANLAIEVTHLVDMVRVMTAATPAGGPGGLPASMP